MLTGGIGENAVAVREAIVEGLSRLGAVLDPQRNRRLVGGLTGPVTTDDSTLPVWVVPTNEELMIARDTMRIVQDEHR